MIRVFFNISDQRELLKSGDEGLVNVPVTCRVARGYFVDLFMLEIRNGIYDIIIIITMRMAVACECNHLGHQHHLRARRMPTTHNIHYNEIKTGSFASKRVKLKEYSL